MVLLIINAIRLIIDPKPQTQSTESTMCSASVKVPHICINVNKNIEQRL